MKKYFLTILLALQTHLFVYGQEDKLFGRWITPVSDFMLINKPKNKVILTDFSVLSEYKEGWTKLRYDLTLIYRNCSNDTLRFYRTLYSYPDQWETENYDFKIILQNDTSITLIPVTFFSKKLFQNKDTLSFIRQENAITEIHFQKLSFYFNGYFRESGRNQQIIFRANILQIDSVGNVYMQKETLINDSYVAKYLKGTLKRSLFKEMVNLLQTCNLETLDWGNNRYTDTFEQIIVVNYNNKKKELKSGVPSPISQPLIDFLMNMEKQAKLKETKDKISLE
ncbi:MAG: hypothetical protein FWF54_04925 [Candidatus Azobacteroides sp.]|nr:hypothetical protein [Candidatus Azobacteroides sp.]